MMNLDELIETFEKHAKKHAETEKIIREDNKRKWGDESFPDGPPERFSLPQALAFICKEIKALKEWREKDDHYY
jgi:hypothetical protein